MDSTQIAFSLEALQAAVKLDSTVPAAARQKCQEALDRVVGLLNAQPTQMYIGTSDIEPQPHDAAFNPANGRIHVDCSYFKDVQEGRIEKWDLANSLLHEAFHLMGEPAHDQFGDNFPIPQWGLQYVTAPYSHLNHPGYQSQGWSCIDYESS